MTYRVTHAVPHGATRRRAGARRGFTLVEMLSALALSALLIVALLKLQQNAGSAHVAAEGRAAATQRLIVLRRELAAAVGGAIPSCAKADNHFTLINDHRRKFWLQPFESTLRVYAGDEKPKDVKKTGSRPGERRADSDFLVVRGAVLPAVTVTSHTAAGAFRVSDATGFRRGDVALICDEQASVLFQITNDVGKGLLRYSGGGVTPGNCANAFHAADCGRGYVFSGAAVATRYAASVFYVGVGKSGDGFSLYRRRLPDENSGAKQRATLLQAEEIVTGIRRMTAHVIVRDGGRFRYARSDAGAGRPFAIEIEAVIAARTGLADDADDAGERHVFTLVL